MKAELQQVGDDGQGVGTTVQFPMDSKSYKLVCEIGISEHSTVYKAICKPMNSATVAVKVIDMDTRLNMDLINSLSLIHHDNILSPHCCFMVADHHRQQLWIVMPFFHAGSLETIIATRFKNGLPDQFLAIILHHLLSALLCLHQLGHLHNNIKPSNIFVDSEGTIKLSDVNVFKPINTGHKASDDDDDSYSIPYWVAPEVGRRQRFNNNDNYDNNDDRFKSDVWGIGVLALEIAYGCPPISHSRACTSQFMTILRRFPYGLHNNNNIEKKLVSNNNNNNVTSDLFKDLVSCCLVKYPSRRPSAMTLLTHSLVKKGEGCSNNNYANVLFKRMMNNDMMGIEYSFEEIKERLLSSLMKKKKKGGGGNKSTQSTGKLPMKKKKLDDDESNKTTQTRGKLPVMMIKCWNFNNLTLELEPEEEMISPLKEEGGGGGGGREEESDHEKLLSPLKESFRKLVILVGKYLKQETERGKQLDTVVRREIKRLNMELMASLKLETDLKIELNTLKSSM